MRDRAPVLEEPTILQEGSTWLVLVPGYGGTVQTYECDTEAKAQNLLKLFRAKPAASPAPRR